MPITIEPVVSLSDLAELIGLYRKLEEMEPQSAPAPFRLRCARPGMHLLARYKGKPVAALTVAETTGDTETHRRFGLRIPAGAGAARYAGLAVLPAYRGRNLPVRLMEEARRLFVNRRSIRYTWLEPEHALRPRFAATLGYRPAAGCRRVLVRDEWAGGSAVDSTLRGMEAVCTQAG